MPKRRPAGQCATASSFHISKAVPFSLVLPRSEMNTLREIAGKEGVSIAVVVRRAIHTVIGRAHPEFGREVAETEADTFLDQLAARSPIGMLTVAKREAFKGRLVRALG